MGGLRGGGSEGGQRMRIDRLRWQILRGRGSEGVLMGIVDRGGWGIGE